MIRVDDTMIHTYTILVIKNKPLTVMVDYAVETPVASSRSAGLTMSPSIFAKFGSRFNTAVEVCVCV